MSGGEANVLTPENLICLIVRLPVTLNRELGFCTYTIGMSSTEGSTHSYANRGLPVMPNSLPKVHRSGSIVML